MCSHPQLVIWGFMPCQVEDKDTNSEAAYTHLFIMVGEIALDSAACYARRRKLLKKYGKT